MRVKEKVPKEKCECEVSDLLAAAKSKSREWFRYIPWNKEGGYLYCDKHRVYHRIEWTA